VGRRKEHGKKLHGRNRPQQGASRPRGRRSATSRRAPEMVEFADAVVGLLYGRDDLLGVREIADLLEFDRRQGKVLRSLLTALCREGLLVEEDGGFMIGPDARVVDGMLSVHPKGFAFVAVAEPPAWLVIERDIFLPPTQLASASHGDRVLVAVTKIGHERAEGRVVRVLNRATNRVVGTYTVGRPAGLVTPEDERLAFQVVVRSENSGGAKNGDAVVAEITDYRLGGANPEGRIVEVLGDPESLQVQTDMVVRKFELPHTFGEQALAQAEAFPEAVVMEAGRVDLREIKHVTIDGETARDFDDAVAVIKNKSGYRLYVSIADVSHYVTPGSPLDTEAYQRGTSVYFPTRVVPMLPERLSNNLCSLVPDEDRYAFTAILDFDRKGHRIGKQFTKSLIRSQRRLTYTMVRQVLVDDDGAVKTQLKGLLTQLKWMGELAAEIEKQRMARGSIGFELPEAQIELGPDETVAGIGRMERNQAHKIIEEFMLAANEAVATTFDEMGMPSLYRVHEPPDPVKVSEFVEFGGSLGFRLPSGSGTPAWFGKVLKLAAGTPQEYIINNLLLRTMQQARYSPDNVGHFGLAAEYYTHFTSPIRRYPDLMVHRALSRLLAAPKAKVKSAAGQSPAESLGEAGGFLSKRERTAVDAEREVVDRIKVRFMTEKVGESFDGVVAGATSFGLFVELLDVFVNGAVAIGEMRDDYYHFDEKHHRLMGKRTGNVFQIGDLVRVRVAGVDAARRHINFDRVEKIDSAPAAGGKSKA